MKVFGEAVMETGTGGKSFEFALDNLAKKYAPDKVLW
jgi:hypothetical protein